MNIVDSKNIPYELGNRHSRRNIARMVRKGLISQPVPSAPQVLQPEPGDVTSVPSAFVEENPTSGYADSRTEEEKANEPETTVTTTEPPTDIPEAAKVISRLVDPHKTVSTPVTDEDVERVIEDGQILVDLCFMANGMYQTAYAMAHPQIEKEKPLRFFCLANGLMICNPRITRHTRHPVDSEEGCMSFPSKAMITVPRYHKIDVEFQTVTTDKKLSELKTSSFSGRDAKIWQHEISHLNGHYMYDEDFSPENALPISE